MHTIKSSAFRGWAHNLWIENCEERTLYSNGDRLNEQEYWHRFRWWLRREWRYLQQRDQTRRSVSQYFTELGGSEHE